MSDTEADIVAAAKGEIEKLRSDEYCYGLDDLTPETADHLANVFEALLRLIESSPGNITRTQAPPSP